ncbi:MAG: T9SS type A sorting domain-containing protein [Cyclobacteriaceae bacterium]
MRNLSVLVIWTIIFPAFVQAQTEIRVGDPGVIFDESKFDSDYPEIQEWITSGVEGGIPLLEDISAEITIEPTNSEGIASAMTEVASMLGEGEFGAVILKNGIYHIDPNLNMRSYVRLVGESRDGVILRVTPSSERGNEAAITFNSSRFTGLENLTIEGYYNGEIPNDFTMENNKTDFVSDMVTFPSNSENCWIQKCNVLNSGNSAISSWKCSHITIRDNYIERSFNKGGGGRGYVALQGDHILFYNNVVRKMRHVAIQREGAEYIVVFRNYLEQDVNFHNADAGRNLIEQNIVRLPAQLLPGWHAMMGPWSSQHDVPGPRSAIFRNDCIEFNNNDTVSFSDPNLVYIPARFEARQESDPSPFDVSTNIPSGGTFYPASNVIGQDVRPSFNNHLFYDQTQEGGSVTLSPDTPFQPYDTDVEISATAEIGSKFRHWEGSFFSLENPVTVKSDTNRVFRAVFTDVGETLTWIETFEKYESGKTSFVGDQYNIWAVSGEIGSDLGSGSSVSLSIDQNITTSIHGGVSDLSFSAKNINNEDGESQIQILINDQVVKEVSHSGTDIFNVEASEINSGGIVNIEIKNTSSSNVVIAIDNVEWTGFDEGARTLSITSVDGEVTQNIDKQTFNNNDEVVIEASPFPGKEFKNWSGDVSSTENPLTVTMDSDKDIIANYENLPGEFEFEEPFDNLTSLSSFIGNYKLKWIIIGSITTLDGSTAIQINKSQKITSAQLERGLSAISFDLKNQFGLGTERKIELLINGAVEETLINSGTQKYTFTLENLNFREPVNFEIRNSSESESSILVVDNIKWTSHDGVEKYSVHKSSGHGNIQISPEQIFYEKGTTVTLTAEADPWLSFEKWGGDISGTDATFQLTVDKETFVEAEFVLIEKDPKLPVSNIVANADPDNRHNIDDFNLDSSWDGMDTDNWIQLELEEVSELDGIHIAWANGKVTRDLFEIRVSIDGDSFIRILDETSSGESSSIQSFPVSGEAKYIRYQRSSANSEPAQISEIIATGTTLSSALSNTSAIPIKSYEIYPNPSKGSVFISTPESTSSLVKVKIINQAGQVVQKENIGSNKINHLKLTEGLHGIYVIQIVDGDNVYKSKLIAL